ncbi:MAG TPA: iron-sulfur cluster assembly accessory protein [Bacteroidetes bacterium]|nr:iron-sulfur cluster assembly accessory protein [Bacteroidota bacterium]
MITISQNALARITQIRADSKVPNSTPLRIGVVGGGCSGLTYQLDFDKNYDPNTQNNDKKFEVDGVQLIVDMRSFLYLAGTQLDYSDGLQGKGFHFNNPNASRTCSCGESFSV